MNFSTICILLLLVVACTNSEIKNSVNSETATAPSADKIDTVLSIHGHSRVDPFFWLRLTDAQKASDSPNHQTVAVMEYLNAENWYTKQMLAHTEKFQDKLYAEITGRIKQDDESVPYFKNGYWYYTRFERDKEYPIYCRKNNSLDSNEEVMLNVNDLAIGYSYYQVNSLNVSPDDKIVAFAVDTLSRRIYTIRFKNLETGETLPDQLENTSGSSAWAKDNTTFFYTTKDEVSLLENRIWKHKLGNDQNQDTMVYEEEDKSFYSGVYNSKSGDYVIIHNTSTLTSDYHILQADDPDGDFQQFTPRETPHEYSIEHFDDKFYVLTNWDATNFKLMETPISLTEKSNWKEVIPHREETFIDAIEVFKGFLVVRERSNALVHLRVINQQTKKEHYLKFDEPAYVVYPATNVELDSDVLRFGYASLTTPNSIFDYNMGNQEKQLKKQEEIVGGHNPNDYQTERIYAVARDNVRVPISLVYKEGIKKDGQNPLLLFGYGAYGISMDPWFNSPRLSLLDRGFIFAIAHIRGGQEMGRQWYESGKMFNKINTFNDFIDCSKHLIKEGYTNEQHLYALGGSAGGLLMGAVVNMEPDLFNGVVTAVPWVDVVTTMLDESIPLTTNEFDEWGNPKNKESYNYLLSYSPYDQVKEQDYPNMLVTTGLYDSQVQYWEPAKWVAKLRDMKTDNNLLLLDIDMDTGHGGSSGRFKRHKRTALMYAFILDLEGIME